MNIFDRIFIKMTNYLIEVWNTTYENSVIRYIATIWLVFICDYLMHGRIPGLENQERTFGYYIFLWGVVSFLMIVFRYLLYLLAWFSYWRMRKIMQHLSEKLEKSE